MMRREQIVDLLGGAKTAAWACRVRCQARVDSTGFCSQLASLLEDGSIGSIGLIARRSEKDEGAVTAVVGGGGGEEDESKQREHELAAAGLLHRSFPHDSWGKAATASRGLPPRPDRHNSCPIRCLPGAALKAACR